MKKIIAATLALTMLTAVGVSAREKIDIKEDPYYYSEENMAKREQKQREADEYMVKVSSTKGYVASKKLPVPMYAQINNYYCGPASAQMIIKYKTGQYVSQETLGKEMETTRNGTLVWQVTESLRARTNVNYLSQSIHSYDMWNATVSNIDKGDPLVYNPKGGRLPNYPGNVGGHYVVGNGYDYYESHPNIVKKLYYIDPWTGDGTFNPFGEHLIMYDKMRSAIDSNTDYYIW